MNNVHLLGANRSYDRSVQTVSVNQVVMLEGYNYDSYVVYEVSRNEWGITYHLINLETHEFHTSDLIRPLSEKFGIGIYYDDANPSFLDPLETAALLTKAKEKKAEEEKKVREAREEYERIAKIGAERLRPPCPDGHKGGHYRHVTGKRVRQLYGLLRLQYSKNRHFRLFQAYTQPLFGNAQACRQF